MKMSDQEPTLAVVRDIAVRLLPPDICEEHGGCRELQEECIALGQRWEDLVQRLQHNLDQLNEKVLFCDAIELNNDVKCTKPLILLVCCCFFLTKTS